MKRLLKPSWVQILAGVLLVIGAVMGMLENNIIETLMQNKVPFLTSVLVGENLSLALFLLGYILLLFETRIKAVRICMILSILSVLMLSLRGYLLYSDYSDTKVFNHMAWMLSGMVYNFLVVYIISILLKHKPMTNTGWIHVIAIVMIINNGEGLTRIATQYVDFVKVNLADFEGFPYSLWVKFILTDILGTIAYYYMATSEVFHRHRLDYPLDVDASKVYSPFNKWMLAAVVVPVVIAASLTVVYLF